MKNATIALLVIFLSAGTVLAEDYKVDTQISNIEWIGKKKVGSQHNGEVQLKGGTLTFTNGKLSGGEVIVDLKTITNLDVSNKTYNKKLVDHLKSEDFFDVANHPTAKLKIKSVKGNTVKADVTIRGITKEISFKVTVKKDSKRVNATANIVFDRAKFNVKYGSSSFFSGLGDKIIEDNISLKVVVIARK